MFKFLVFSSYFLAILPVGIMIARTKPVIRDILFYTIIVLSCLSRFEIHLFPIPDYTGTARGFAFTACFLVTLIVLGSMIFNSQFHFSFFPPGWIFYFLYFIFSCMSIVNADFVLQAGFEVWKMIVMYLILVTAYNYFISIRNFWPLAYTVAGILSLIFFVAFYQKYVLHWWHISSVFPHRNSMSLYCIVFSSFLLGIFMNEKQNRIQNLILLWGIICGSVTILFSLSRGGLVMYGFAQMLVVAASIFLGGFNSKKIQIIFFFSILVSIPLLIALPRILDRFENAPVTSKTTRIYLAQGAYRMAKEYKLGVGLNNFAMKSSPQYEYCRELYETYSEENKSNILSGGIVETIYLLVAAECGWVTMLILMLMFVAYWIMNFRSLLKLRFLPGFGMCAGLFGGLASNYIHSSLEWSLKQENNYIQIMIVFALIAAIQHILRQKKRLSEPHAL